MPLGDEVLPREWEHGRESKAHHCSLGQMGCPWRHTDLMLGWHHPAHLLYKGDFSCPGGTCSGISMYHPSQ